MKICTNCILPETFPGIKFDDAGVCNFCRREEKSIAKSQGKKAEYRQKLDNLVKDLRDKAPTYDVIAAYSGGKDSSYTLKLLKDRYNVRILALTFDNHFVSPIAWKNIETVTSALGVDQITFKPPWKVARDIFSLAAKEDIFPAPTLVRASAICTACIGMVKSIVLKTALELHVPMVAYGWSPGQAPIEASIFKNNPSMIKSMQSVLLEPMRRIVGDDILNYFLTDEHFENPERFPYNVSPLAFLEYDEEKILEEIKALGWVKPEDTDPNSTNCLLNSFGIQVHKKRFKFHPYAYELANLVREGYMDRDEAIERLEAEDNEEIIRIVKRKLGIE